MMSKRHLAYKYPSTRRLVVRSLPGLYWHWCMNMYVWMFVTRVMCLVAGRRPRSQGSWGLPWLLHQCVIECDWIKSWKKCSVNWRHYFYCIKVLFYVSWGLRCARVMHFGISNNIAFCFHSFKFKMSYWKFPHLPSTLLYIYNHFVTHHVNIKVSHQGKLFILT